jgi:hypothetical protein
MATYNGVIRHSVESECQLPNGEKLIRGSFLMSDNYYTGGDKLNLANYFANARLGVIVQSWNGYSLEFNAVAYDAPYAGKVKAYASIGNTIGTPFSSEVAVNTDLSACNAVFFAWGKSK